MTVSINRKGIGSLLIDSPSYMPPSLRLSPKDLDDLVLNFLHLSYYLEILMVIISFGVPKMLMIKAE